MFPAWSPITNRFAPPYIVCCESTHVGLLWLIYPVQFPYKITIGMKWKATSTIISEVDKNLIVNVDTQSIHYDVLPGEATVINMA